jgi:hypothetical protein
MGIAVFSPPLDHHGNSVRGIAFCKELLTRHPLGIFQSIVVQSKLSLFDAGAHSVAGETLSLLWVRLRRVLCDRDLPCYRCIVVSLHRCMAVRRWGDGDLLCPAAASLYRCTGNDFSLTGRRSRPTSAAVTARSPGPRGGDASGSASEMSKKKAALARALRIRKVLRSLRRLHAALMEAGRKSKAAPTLTAKL